MKQAFSHSTLARLLFVSQSTHPLGHASDIDVFRAASRNNNAQSISGVILRGETWFCQVLEGHGPALETTWERISTDWRHGSIQSWWQTDVPIRLFSNWHNEHWGISPQVERVFLSMIQADLISTADKITLVRAFAQLRRSGSIAAKPRSGVEHLGDARLDDRQIREAIDAAQ